MTDPASPTPSLLTLEDRGRALGNALISMAGAGLGEHFRALIAAISAGLKAEGFTEGEVFAIMSAADKRINEATVAIADGGNA